MMIYYIFCIIAGILHGAREAYHADNSVLEWIIRKTNTDYFGAKSWLNKYVDNDVKKGYKSFLHKYIPFDFWHQSNDLIFTCLMLFAYLSSYWYHLVIGYIIMSTTAMINYTLLRQKK